MSGALRDGVSVSSGRPLMRLLAVTLSDRFHARCSRAILKVHARSECPARRYNASLEDDAPAAAEAHWPQDKDGATT